MFGLTRTSAAFAAVLATVCTSSAAARPNLLTGSIDITCSLGQCGQGAGWTCNQPVMLDSVSVTVDTPKAPQGNPIDGVRLAAGCTGTIRLLTVQTVSADGMKIGNGAQDITVGSGSITCTGRDGTVHQDGIQALGGTQIALDGLVVRCTTANNAQFYINGKRPRPSDIVCTGCEFHPDPTHIHSVTIGKSLRSGADDSLVCPGRSPTWVFYDLNATDPVNVDNRFPASC